MIGKYLLINLRFSDLYRNVGRYLKHHECTHDFTGTRQWLTKRVYDRYKVETAVRKVQSAGADCDCEIISKVKPVLNGGTLLIGVED